MSYHRPVPKRSIPDFPRLGRPGSRAAELHFESLRDASPAAPGLRLQDFHHFLLLRWVGTVGALMIGIGGLGAGALPVVNNPYGGFPLGDVMSRMLQTSSSVVLIGVGLVVLAWLLMSRYVGSASVTVAQLLRTLVAWSLPIFFTAPLFTQDIYSYLAQGSVVTHGMDPYSAGPVELLGTENHLARSVPFIWAQSPSPYGPVALAISALINDVTRESIVLGVLAHRGVSVLGIALSAWAIVHLARRCGVRPPTALWLGVLNPLTLLHLIGGIHNEAILLGLALAGMELGLRGVDALDRPERSRGVLLLAASIALISSAGMVKVTGFLGLGFVGMALARHLNRREHGRALGPTLSVLGAALVMTVGLVATVAAVTLISGIDLGWVTGQGGAATIRSWMSLTTDVGVIAGVIGMLLGLGDHTEAILIITRGVGVVVAVAFIVRMLFATFRGTIHPVGGLGVGTFILVILFPVVHPWYMLWAILPLATWANRPIFRVAVMIYSAAMSFFVLPRGLALPGTTVLTIYVSAAVFGALLIGLGWLVLRRARVVA